MTTRAAILGVGTATFIPAYGLGCSPVSTGIALLSDALDRGVTYVDTAASYADAEEVLGALAERLTWRRVRIATKVGVTSGISVLASDALAANVLASLTRLRTAAVDTLLWHSADAADLRSAEVAEASERIIRCGLATKVGASTYGRDDARAALEQPWCSVVQFEYSVLNPSVLEAVLANQRPGQELVARSVLCKGLLTPRWRGSPAVARGLEPTLEALEGTAAAWGMPLNELAIRFALDTPGLDVVLVGVASPDELDSACRAAGRDVLTPDQMAHLAAFDRAATDTAHPERWTRVSTT